MFTSDVIVFIVSLFQDEDGLATIYNELSPHCFLISSQFTDLEQCKLQIDQSLVDGVILQPRLYCQTVSQTFADVAKIGGNSDYCSRDCYFEITLCVSIQIQRFAAKFY